MKPKYFFLAFASLILMVSCMNVSDPKTIKGNIFGSTYQIQYFGNENLKPELLSAMARFDSLFSTYRDDSEIIRFNQSDKGLNVSEPFLEVFKFCQEQNEITQGYFDPSLQPLINHYGFGKTWQNSDLEQARQVSGIQNFTIKGDSLIKSNPENSLNFNAITGYANDWVAEVFRQNSIENYLIEIGGEITAAGTKLEKKPWIAGIDNPEVGLKGKQEIQFKVKLTEKVLATSGNYRKYKTDSLGKKIVHTINPISGEAFQGELMSATVVLSNSGNYPTAKADATATALMAMGKKDKVEEFLRQNREIQALITFQDKQGYLNTKFYNGFKGLLVE